MDLLWLLLVIGSYQVLMLYAQLLAAEVLLAIAASFNALNSLLIKPSKGSEKSDKTEIVLIQSIESKSSFEGEVLMLRNRWPRTLHLYYLLHTTYYILHTTYYILLL